MLAKIKESMSKNTKNLNQHTAE